jgi:hypothetical protein
MIPIPQNNRLMLGDCVDLMRGVAAGSVAPALTDPAYFNRGVMPVRPPPGAASL